MKLIKIAVIAALVVSGSAMAFPFHQSAENSTLKIYQQGVNNNTTALQSDAKNSTTEINQLGTANGADVGQVLTTAKFCLIRTVSPTTPPSINGTVTTPA